jgi:hypothetical protein
MGDHLTFFRTNSYKGIAMLSRLKASCFLFVVCAMLSGCGDKLARVEGTVTFNGEPVSRGMINLEPTDGKGSVYGASVENGKFLIEDVLPGEKIVRISAAYTKEIKKEADGSEIEICDDLLPVEYGQNSKERLNVEAPSTKKDYAFTGTDPRKKK